MQEEALARQKFNEQRASLEMESLKRQSCQYVLEYDAASQKPCYRRAPYTQKNCDLALTQIVSPKFDPNRRHFLVDKLNSNRAWHKRETTVKHVKDIGRRRPEIYNDRELLKTWDVSTFY